MKIREIKTKQGYLNYTVTIPKSLITALGIKKGDAFDWSMDGTDLRLKKVVVSES